MNSLVNTNEPKRLNEARAKFAKNTALQYGLEIARYAFPLLTVPYLTRVLGPDVYAVRAYILAAMTFMQVFLSFGFNPYGTKEIAEHQNDLQHIRVETSAIAMLRVALCAVGGVSILLIVPHVPIMAEHPVYVAIAYSGACFKAMLPDFVFRGLEDMGIITYRYIVSQTVATVFIFLLVRSDADLLLVPLFEALAELIAFLWSWSNVIFKRGIRFISPGMDRLIGAFRAATVFFLSNASTTIYTSLTTLMIGIYVSDAAEISYWSIAMTAIQAIQTLYTPVSNSLYPHMCVQRDFALVKRLLIVGIPVVVIGTAAFALLSDIVMQVVGGPDYVDGAYVVAMVSPVLFFSFPAILLGFPVLAAVGWVRALTVSSLIPAVFHIVGLFLIAVGGWFSIAAVAILRCCTEAVLMASRVLFVFLYFRAARKGGRSRAGGGTRG